MKKIIIISLVLASTVSISGLAKTAPPMSFEQVSMGCANAIQAQLTPPQLRAWGSELLEMCQNGIKAGHDSALALKIITTLEDERVNAVQNGKFQEATELALGAKFYMGGLFVGGMNSAVIQDLANRASRNNDGSKTNSDVAPVAKKSKMICDAVVYDDSKDEPTILQNHKGEASITFHSDSTATVVVPFKNGDEYDGQPHSFETMPLNKELSKDDDKAALSEEGSKYAFTPVLQNWDIVLANCK